MRANVSWMGILSVIINRIDPGKSLSYAISVSSIHARMASRCRNTKDVFTKSGVNFQNISVTVLSVSFTLMTKELEINLD